jgi:uncharacterized protein (DUF983 family)
MMDIARAKRILARSMKLRCPACGEGELYQTLFRMNKQCPFCEFVYQREQGYFVGAIYVNVIVTESLIFFTYLASLLLLPASSGTIYTALFVMALTIPVIFYRHARSLWLGFDYFVDPPDKRVSPTARLGD